MKNIVLIGFRGTGKTSVGKLLSKRLKREFIDIDAYIEATTGKTIKQIFAEEGEEGFRRVEAASVAKLGSLDNKVIAAGGGAVLRNENVKNLKSNGVMILLKATPEIIYKRIIQDEKTTQQRPSLTNKKPFEEIKHLLEQRRQSYEKAADYTIDTSHRSRKNIVEELINNYYL